MIKEDVATGIDRLITRFTPPGTWQPPCKGSPIVEHGHSGPIPMCISDALHLDHPGGFVPLRGHIGEFLGAIVGTYTTYYWENQEGRIHQDVVDLLNKAFEKIMDHLQSLKKESEV